MQVKKITYSESKKMTTGIKFESRLVSISAEAELMQGEEKEKVLHELKDFVKSELQKEISKSD